VPSGAAAASSARVTVVPTATTRPRVAFTAAAVAAGIRYRSGSGISSASRDETPVCSVRWAVRTPRARRASSTAGVNGRPALGISALPNSPGTGVAKTVRYSSIGHGSVTWG
jgi:hypothetical protein